MGNYLLPPRRHANENTTSRSSPPHQALTSDTSPHASPRVDVTKQVVHVPFVSSAVLDFLPDSTSPKSAAKTALLSNDSRNNCIALVGMGGVGKTTILCALAMDSDIRAKFSDGIWFFEFGRDITLSSFLRQMYGLIESVFPDFLEDFNVLIANENDHIMVTQLTNRLSTKRFLLLFDDVWNTNASVAVLLHTMCILMEGKHSASSKILTSTRNSDVAKALTSKRAFGMERVVTPENPSISVDPEHPVAIKCLRIFCHHAHIDPSIVSSSSAQDRNTLYRILNTCGGLPLALSVAGSTVGQLIDPHKDQGYLNAVARYWKLLKMKTPQLSDAESIGRGLSYALQVSLDFVEQMRQSKKMTATLASHLTAEDMFRSLCIFQKNMIPMKAIKKLWNVSDVVAQVRIFSRNSILSEVLEGKETVGVRVHELLLDTSMVMAQKRGEVMMWHGKLLDAYRLSLNAKTERDNDSEADIWLCLDASETYMLDNVVRHLLGAGRVIEALSLVTDYRWVERINEDEEQLPFHKVITDLQLLQNYLETSQRTQIGRKVAFDLAVVVRAMALCMVPYCAKNRRECTFQLFGRLRDLQSESGIIERILHSIERYGRRPWVRAGPGLLPSGQNLVKRVLTLENEPNCMSIDARDDEVVMGGFEGNVLVVDGRDGSMKKSLVYDEAVMIADVFINHLTECIYSCSSRGRIVIWKNYEIWQSVSAEGLDKEDCIKCMLVLPKCQIVVLGTHKGRLLVIDMECGTTIQAINAHADCVTSLVSGVDKDVFVSGSDDRTIRVWDGASFKTRVVLEGHTDRVTSVSLSGDGKLLASGSKDGTLRMWDVLAGELLWTWNGERDRYVQLVLFSSDGRILYSAGHNGTLREWRVSDGGRNICLMHDLPFPTKSSIKMLCMGGNSELFALSGNQIHVLDVQYLGIEKVECQTFLPRVDSFAISPDEKTIATFNELLGLTEIRDMCDVFYRIDRVISHSFHTAQARMLAVSNDRQFIAFSVDDVCNVHIVNIGSEDELHTFSDLEKWALSSSSNCQNTLPDAGSNDSIETLSVEPWRNIESLCFSSDSSTISAVAVVERFGEISVIKKKSLSWNTSSKDLLPDQFVEGDPYTSNNAVNSRMVCKEQSPTLSINRFKTVQYKRNGSSKNLATLDHYESCAHYCSDTSRLWFSRESGGLQHVDLVTNDTPFPPRDEPPLPSLSQSHPPPTQHTLNDMGTDTDAEEVEVYDVFISHAGPDKNTIAKPLYDLLVALGFKVFLDICELRPGENAPIKMINAMRTAKIAVVILSPEFAARKWTMKELMCFLERFRAGGEREVMIIPVFYRLTLDDCKDENALFSAVDENGENVFIKEGFLLWMVRENEYGIRDVMNTLQALRSVTGIENVKGVTNGSSAEEGAGRMELVEEIVRAIVEAKQRLANGTASGPSRTSHFA